MKKAVARSSALVEWSLRHPGKVYAIVILLCLCSILAFPFAQIDTNPKNMLPETSDVRVWNHHVDQTFGLHEDVIVVGVVHAQGVLNPETLQRVVQLTDEIRRVPGVAARDVTSLSTVDNVTADAEGLAIRPLLPSIPDTAEALSDLKDAIYDSDLFVGRLIAEDGTATLIHVPLEAGANGKSIADEIKAHIAALPAGDEQFHVAGDPVARDTFGAEMFKLMAIFSPIAGGIMCLVLYFMFRSVALVMSMMAVAMASILWSMALLIAFGYPIHIMSSMAPVFLMAIATDSIHIFNEFYFRYRESPDRKTAIIRTMAEVARPVQYTALATAAGFGVLLFMEIIPVKVFGGMILFGTLALRVLSFSLIPAILLKVSQTNLERSMLAAQSQQGASNFLQSIARIGTRKPVTTLIAGLVVIAFAGIGMTKIVVNNNQLEWFTADSVIRQADEELSRRLGGTALGYVVASGTSADAIKQPETLRYLDQLQRHIEEVPDVSKTFSVVNYVKRIHQVLHDNDPSFYGVPADADTVGQYLFIFSMAARPADLNNVVDYPFQNANIWVQLKSWDAQSMARVTKAVADFQASHPFPIELKPAGTAHFNVVWNQEVLWDMVKGFGLALIAVYLLLLFDFRSWRWALLGYVPLMFTILLIYGVIGWSGKDFDMPISVLSCLSLGMAVDFSIHFISRFRQHYYDADRPRSAADLESALLWTAGRPGRGIFRNAILFAAAFAVMLFAPLTPYMTVGAFIVSMMLLSALATILFLPALIMVFHRWLGEPVARTSTTNFSLNEAI